MRHLPFIFYEEPKDHGIKPITSETLCVLSVNNCNLQHFIAADLFVSSNKTWLYMSQLGSCTNLTAKLWEMEAVGIGRAWQSGCIVTNH